MKFSSLLHFASRSLIGGGTFDKDCLRIFVRGGPGGAGIAKLKGIGGDGGDVILEARSDVRLARLEASNPTKRFVGLKGNDSRTLCAMGEKGKNLIVPVPVGSTVLTDDNRFIAELTKDGERVNVAVGGDGGSPATKFQGQHGLQHIIRIDLKLVSDICMIGFPNSGKSTLFGQLAAYAEPQISAAPFTTVRPQLAQMHFEDGRKISIADMPALHEGSHRNVGWPNRFLKHTERALLLLFVVDVNGFQFRPNWPKRTAVQTILLLNKEIELYKPELLKKPAFICLNKIDLDSHDERLTETKHRLANLADFLHDVDEELRPKQLLNFHGIYQISAKHRQGTSILKQKLREAIDYFDDLHRLQHDRSDSQALSIDIMSAQQMF